MTHILVTGAAGFIGFHLCQRLLARGDRITGWDNLNDYYDVQLKRDRLSQLTGHGNFSFEKLEIADRQASARALSTGKFDVVLHMAAQAGVRYSLENPQSYIDTNLVGFGNVLEGCRHNGVRHLVYASSSSVYGSNTKMPFSVLDNVDHPVSLYAATKKANELLAHSYSHLFRLPTTGLRFFTVYGPWGRPDMALFKFTAAMLAGKPIEVFNNGQMKRDFTYIDDIVEGVIRTADHVPAPNPHWSGDSPDPSTSTAPYRVYNIGNHQPVELSHFIDVLERTLGVTAKRNYLPMQLGDVPATFADIDELTRDVGFHPRTSIEEGIKRFVEWYRGYYQKTSATT